MAEYPYPPRRKHTDPDIPDSGPKAVILTDFEKDVKQVFADAQALLLRKHKDYGPKNISQSPGGALNGLRVRMWDKTARLNNLLDKGYKPEYESVKDTLIDLLNYSAIAILVLEKKWPEK